MKNLLIATFPFLSLFAHGQLEYGSVVDTVMCASNKQTYSLYLPSYYSPEKPWPIIYFFEPAARGSLPVRLYSDVDEELGFILVCSNNSRNGSFQLGFEAADAMFADTETKLSIDTERIYTSGFSGGSRLALSIAVLYGNTKGVIGVGATQPPVPAYSILERKKFLYVGLVGALDMNYQEHKSFAKYLDGLGMKNLLLVSNMRHSWASPEDFRLALLWLEENKSKFEDGISDKMEVENDSIPLSDLIYLNQLIPEKSLTTLETKETNKALRSEAKYLRAELNLRATLQDSIDAAFLSSDPNSRVVKWITKEARRIISEKEKSKNIGEWMMYERVLTFLGGFPFENARFMIDQGLYSKALIGITIWQSTTQNYIYANWMLAKVYSLSENIDKSKSFHQ